MKALTTFSTTFFDKLVETLFVQSLHRLCCGAIHKVFERIKLHSYFDRRMEFCGNNGLEYNSLFSDGSIFRYSIVKT